MYIYEVHLFAYNIKLNPKFSGFVSPKVSVCIQSDVCQLWQHTVTVNYLNIIPHEDKYHYHVVWQRSATMRDLQPTVTHVTTIIMFCMLIRLQSNLISKKEMLKKSAVSKVQLIIQSRASRSQNICLNNHFINLIWHCIYILWALVLNFSLRSDFYKHQIHFDNNNFPAFLTLKKSNIPAATAKQTVPRN